MCYYFLYVSKTFSTTLLDLQPEKHGIKGFPNQIVSILNKEREKPPQFTKPVSFLLKPP